MHYFRCMRADALRIASTASRFLFLMIALSPAYALAYTPAAPADPDFIYSFNTPGTLYASEYMQNTTSPYFWISSGGRMIIENGIGKTIQGRLPTGDISQVDYARVNPLDTDGGHYPQNTFRLVTRNTWGNGEESVQFRVTAQNLTNTPNRDGYSGIFLFSRYKDKDNLYYAGIRDDGLAVLKKKIGGEYYTLTYAQAFGTWGAYDKFSNPSLIPSWQWIGLKARTTTLSGGKVKIELLVDRANTGNWQPLVSYVDSGVGGAAFTGSGSGGIRTDYMDVQFDEFRFKAL